MPLSNPYGPQGAVGMSPRTDGVWSAANTYNYRDLVSHSNGGSYLALASGLTGAGHDPATDTANWLQIAARGPAGVGGGGGTDTWRRDICPYVGYTNIQGTWAVGAATTSGALGNLNNSSAALNDGVSFDIGMEPGTWTIDLLGVTFTNRGIITVTLDTTALGTWDMYAAAATYQVLKTFTGVTVAASGKHTLKLQATSKNAAASAYAMAIQWIALVRTA